MVSRSRAWTVITPGLYIALILAADILAARWIVPLPFGLAVPAGVFAIAPVFTLRDDIHESWGRKGAYVLIGIACILSWLLSAITSDAPLARVTLASGIAFVANEIVDTELYHRIRGRSKITAILTSNAISSFLDSLIFIWIAFGLDWQLIFGQYICKMSLATIVAPVVVFRTEFPPLPFSKRWRRTWVIPLVECKGLLHPKCHKWSNKHPGFDSAPLADMQPMSRLQRQTRNAQHVFETDNPHIRR